MKPFKVGVIGAGFVGPLHVEALRRLGGIEVVALADENENLARQKAEILAIPRAYGDWHTLVSDPEVEVVHNCTPNYLHFDINKMVIAENKPLVAEKPLGMTSAESAEMLRMVTASGLPNLVCFTYCMYPAIQELHAIVTSGEIGTPWIIGGCYLQDWLWAPTDYNWRIDPAISGPSRAIADIGSHWCELAQFVTGQQITAVCAQVATVHPFRKKMRHTVEAFANVGQTATDYDEIKIDTEDWAAVLVRFSGGAVGTFSVSQVSAGRKNHILLEVNGSKASVAWNHEDADRLWIGRRDAYSQHGFRDASLMHESAREFSHYPAGHPEGYSSGFKNLFQAFYGYLRAEKRWGVDTPNFPTFWEGHRSMLTLDAILHSARERSWIDVDFTSLPGIRISSL